MRYWKRIDQDGMVTTIESYSHTQDIIGAFEITEKEYDELLSILVDHRPLPSRDLAKEMDELKASLSSQSLLTSAPLPSRDLVKEMDELKASLSSRGLI